MKTQTLLQTIGNTPLVELKKFSISKNVKIFAKLEGFNPGGSIKDRIAKYMILDAEKKGVLHKSKTIIEATSGNTGIGLAMIAAIKGYKFVAVMPESASIERRKILKQFGAEIILTDSTKGTNYSIEVATKILNTNPNKYVMLNQFENQANVKAHYQSTATEILKQIPNITHLVAGVGTGGTITGIGKKLKEYNSQIQIIAVEPLQNSKIQGLRNMKEYKPLIFNSKFIDKTILIKNDKKAFKLAKKLHKDEGLLVGISTGASLWGALEIAKNINKANIVIIAPDKSDRYISTELFDN